MDDLSKHKREWNDTEKFEELCRLCGIVVSHMISAREAAWREDEELLKLHLGHAREALILTLKLAKK